MNWNQPILDNAEAMECSTAICLFAGLDVSKMTPDEIVDASGGLSAACRHDYGPTHGGKRVCLKCGGIQSNGVDPDVRVEWAEHLDQSHKWN